ncbi:MAG: hypothetical protein ACOX2X_06345 [Peptococcia bacterium]
MVSGKTLAPQTKAAVREKRTGHEKTPVLREEVCVKIVYGKYY